MKRHEAAVGVQEGVINLCSIARVLAEAAEEAAGEGVGAERDAAVRVIVHRLARLCRVDEISYGYDPVTLADTYRTLMDECKTRAKEKGAGGVLPPLVECRADALPAQLQHILDRRRT
jgi:replicative DNA helicase